MSKKTKYIKEVLMCRPTNYSVEYVINPWMKPGSVNQKKALAQWETIVEAFKSLQIKVNTIDQVAGVPDMVFTTDQGIVQKNKVLVSNFRYPQRQKERPHYLKWFQDNQFYPHFLPEDCFFEGNGEGLFWNSLFLMGSGFRSSKNATKHIAKALDTEVVTLELINPKLYHLDMCLLPLNDNTVFYFDQAFSNSSKQLLKKMVPQLLPLDEKEVHNFAANSVVTDHHVVMAQGNPKFKLTLENLGYRTIELNVSEFMKAGGGIHCLTGILNEELA